MFEVFWRRAFLEDRGLVALLLNYVFESMKISFELFIYLLVNVVDLYTYCTNTVEINHGRSQLGYNNTKVTLGRLTKSSGIYGGANRGLDLNYDWTLGF